MSHPHALSHLPLAARQWRHARPVTAVRAFVAEWSRVDATHLAAALAFYAVLSLTPFLLVVVAIAGYMLGSTLATQYLLNEISDVAGAQTAQFIAGLIGNTHPAPAREGIKALIGIGVTLVGATATFAELQHGLDRIFGERVHGAFGVVRTRMLAFGLVIGVAVLSIVSLVLSAGVHAMLASVADADHWRAVLSAAANEVVSFIVLAVAFGGILRVLPECPPGRRGVCLGAFTAAIAFVVGKFAIGWYLAHFALASAYGAAGAVVVVMLWIYWSSALFFAGAVVARITDRRSRDQADSTELAPMGIA
ncbi:MAG TPA: YihY/virulence factor BrkB family protein [Casimicrobiaceae bacterium]|nr:YihY/virulence factor BrkB family protein [Casimicrobiaceae bacterium]